MAKLSNFFLILLIAALASDAIDGISKDTKTERNGHGDQQNQLLGTVVSRKLLKKADVCDIDCPYDPVTKLYSCPDEYNCPCVLDTRTCTQDGPDAEDSE